MSLHMEGNVRSGNKCSTPALLLGRAIHTCSPSTHAWLWCCAEMLFCCSLMLLAPNIFIIKESFGLFFSQGTHILKTFCLSNKYPVIIHFQRVKVILHSSSYYSCDKLMKMLNFFKFFGLYLHHLVCYCQLFDGSNRKKKERWHSTT